MAMSLFTIYEDVALYKPGWLMSNNSWPVLAMARWTHGRRYVTGYASVKPADRL